MKCGNCGNVSIKDEDKFCEQCGTALYQEEKINIPSMPVVNNFPYNYSVIKNNIGFNSNKESSNEIVYKNNNKVVFVLCIIVLLLSCFLVYQYLDSKKPFEKEVEEEIKEKETYKVQYKDYSFDVSLELLTEKKFQNEKEQLYIYDENRKFEAVIETINESYYGYVNNKDYLKEQYEKLLYKLDDFEIIDSKDKEVLYSVITDENGSYLVLYSKALFGDMFLVTIKLKDTKSVALNMDKVVEILNTAHKSNNLIYKEFESKAIEIIVPSFDNEV